MIDATLRVAFTAAHKLLKLGWFVRRPKTFGAHAVALTREGRLILVKLRYAPGWRLPGGGRHPQEPATDAALRELREEIGMTSHGAFQLACELEEPIDFKRDTSSLVIVRNVGYRPHRWNWEVEQVREAELHDLPPGTSPQTARWLEAVAPHL
ncbi:MAG: NUDIX domain-containing protein [Sphingomonas sp.]|nr:NUDIX domain-containing protein [Sphingomonas sp.]